MRASLQKKTSYTDKSGNTKSIYFDNDLYPYQRAWNYSARKLSKTDYRGRKIAIDKWNCRLWVDGRDIPVHLLPRPPSNSNTIHLGTTSGFMGNIATIASQSESASSNAAE